MDCRQGIKRVRIQIPATILWWTQKDIKWSGGFAFLMTGVERTKPMWKRFRLLSLLLVLPIAVSALGDTISLRNGRRYTGVFISGTAANGILFRDQRGVRHRFALRDVQFMEFGGPAFSEQRVQPDNRRMQPDNQRVQPGRTGTARCSFQEERSFRSEPTKTSIPGALTKETAMRHSLTGTYLMFLPDWRFRKVPEPNW